ncbi:MAG: hypothetical protein ABW061_05730 [Polyangiaceae bacterium]
MPFVRSSLPRLGLLGWLLLSCGTGTHSSIPDDVLSDAGPSVQVFPNVNVCPVFSQSLIIPRAISPRASAEVIVFATDPDGVDTALEFDWTATSGSFSDPRLPATRYSCRERGPQVLSVRALDRLGCRTQLDLDVTCSDD